MNFDGNRKRASLQQESRVSTRILHIGNNRAASHSNMPFNF
jgi:hypothetical protein